MCETRIFNAWIGTAAAVALVAIAIILGVCGAAVAQQGAAGAHFRVARKAPISGAGDLISTTTKSSIASNPSRTPWGAGKHRQVP